MITPKEHFHGSDLEKIEAVYGIKKEDITSFSANVQSLSVSPLREVLWLPILSHYILPGPGIYFFKKMYCCLYRHRCQPGHCRKWFHGINLSFYSD